MGDPDLSIESDVAVYYSALAQDYDAVQLTPELAAEQRTLASMAEKQLAGRTVLEVACGTGRWTGSLLPHVSNIFATDRSIEMLVVAATRLHNVGHCYLAAVDAYNLNALRSESFTGALIAFWASHVPRQRLGLFFSDLHRTLARGATVFVCDNRHMAADFRLELTDSNGNTFQARTDRHGTSILKNFYSKHELLVAVAPTATAVRFNQTPHYWALAYSVQ
jgi:ubiquinone/menaquinone biosynthesis C-methylase UbiE